MRVYLLFFVQINYLSSFSLNEQTKRNKYLTKKNRVMSLSRLIIKKRQLTDILNTESNLRRTNSNHKKLNTSLNTDYINTENSIIKIKKMNHKF